MEMQFPKLAISQKQDVLRSLENEPKNSKIQIKLKPEKVMLYKREKKKLKLANNSTPQFYPMIKGLVLFGFFTSKPGATKALRYIQTPDGYQADVPYKKGDKAWAT